MNKLISLIIVSFFTAPMISQFKSGFDSKEALDLIALCNSFTYLNLYEDDKAIIPKGYTKIYTSPTMAMDNKYQIYLAKNKKAVVCFRGSTTKTSSWVENMQSAMIPAKDHFIIDENRVDYYFAKDKEAHVHSGYALASTILLQDLLPKIEMLNKKGIYNIYITGHSQGGALAQIIRAQLAHIEKSKLSKRNKFKVYAFANPMIGNQEFVEEYTNDFCNEKMSFSMINPADLVPQMPISYKDNRLITKNEALKLIKNPKKRTLNDLGKDYLVYLLNKPLQKHVNYTNRVFNKLNSKIGKSVTYPKFVADIKYVPMNIRIELQPFEYPKILAVDIFDDKNENGDGEEVTYKKEPSFYQHKPHNYYVGIMKTYYPKQYKKLDKKYLEENL